MSGLEAQRSTQSRAATNAATVGQGVADGAEGGSGMDQLETILSLQTRLGESEKVRSRLARLVSSLIHCIPQARAQIEYRVDDIEGSIVDVLIEFGASVSPCGC